MPKWFGRSKQKSPEDETDRPSGPPEVERTDRAPVRSGVPSGRPTTTEWTTPTEQEPQASSQTPGDSGRTADWTDVPADGPLPASSGRPGTVDWTNLDLGVPATPLTPTATASPAEAAGPPEQTPAPVLATPPAAGPAPPPPKFGTISATGALDEALAAPKFGAVPSMPVPDFSSLPATSSPAAPASTGTVDWTELDTGAATPSPTGTVDWTDLSDAPPTSSEGKGSPGTVDWTDLDD